jgi:hypothetical protein
MVSSAEKEAMQDALDSGDETNGCQDPVRQSFSRRTRCETVEDEESPHCCTVQEYQVDFPRCVGNADAENSDAESNATLC